jgi:hypothetical protein
MDVRKQGDVLPECGGWPSSDVGRMERDAARGMIRIADRAARRRDGRDRAERRPDGAGGIALSGRIGRGGATLNGARRADVARDGASLGFGLRTGGHSWRRSGPLVLRLALGRKHGRQSAGAEIREQFDQRVEDAKQHQTDRRPEKSHDQSLVTPRRDRLAQVVQDDRQIGIGVKREGVGHEI